jgi:signal transduction histidine kinase
MRSGSIHSRLTGVAFVFLMGTSLAMALVGIRLTTTFLSGRFHEHFRLLASYMARNAELGVLFRNSNMLDQLAKNMLEQKDIEGVLITAASGESLIKMEKEKSSVPVMQVTAPVMSARMGEANFLLSGNGTPEQVGMVTITYSVEGLHQLSRAMAFRFMGIAVFLAFASVLVYWVLSRSITAPLYHLVRAAQEVSRGDMDVHAGGGSFLETRTLAKTFNEMLDALKRREAALQEAHASMAKQEAMAEVGRFSMMVAHEVKNPLAIMKGSVDVLRQPGIQPETAETMLFYLEEEVKRINGLMEDFLLFARPREPRVDRVRMDDLVRGVAAKLDLISSMESGVVRLDLKEDGRFCSCDPDLLERALTNVIRNGIEAAGPQGVVNVSTTADATSWSVRVTDRGPGIPPEHVEKVFEPFFTTKAKGTGLGLAIAKRIVEAHGGEIRAETGESGGACFIITLPVVG